MTAYDLLLRCGFSPAQARTLADAGYQVLGWVPVGWASGVPIRGWGAA